MDLLRIKINENSRIPKYIQIVDCMVDDIEKGILPPGSRIPSINELSETCYLSRDTVEKAYKMMRERQIITSVKGKGYYIANDGEQPLINILFMVNKSSTYKMTIYESFVNAIGSKGQVQMSIYHCDEFLFLTTLKKAIGAYSHYVIMPHFRDINSNHLSYTDEVLNVLEKIPKDKLLLLDNIKPAITGKYGSIYQEFKEDIYNALKEAINKIKKYDKIILVYPSKSTYPYPKRILHGFESFCQDFELDYEVLEEIYDDMELSRKDVYITIQERDLVNLVHQVRQKKLILGNDIGIISYNETPLKELLGITVISTDFKSMGELAAQMILNNNRSVIQNAFHYIERNSL